MTENNDIVSVHKITGDRVEIGLAEFITMCNAVKDAKDTEEENKRFREAYKKLSDELEYVRQNSYQAKADKGPRSIIVYRRDLAGNMHVQFIEGMQQGQDGTIYVTIGEPQ